MSGQHVGDPLTGRKLDNDMARTTVAVTAKTTTTMTSGSARGGDNQIRSDLDAGEWIRPDPEGGEGEDGGAEHEGRKGG